MSAPTSISGCSPAAAIFDPKSCTEDLFWIAVWNTLAFVVLQVALMLVVALVTALVLNRDMRGRSFWRAVFFFPVLLSPVVVGLIWRWILQRQGLLNLMLFEMGGTPVNWLVERNGPSWRRSWCRSGRMSASMR